MHCTMLFKWITDEMLSICLINHGCAVAAVADVVVIAANAVSKKNLNTCDYDGDCVCSVW